MADDTKSVAQRLLRFLLIYLPLKLLQLVFFLIAAGMLLFGLYDNSMTVLHLGFGEAVEGRITSVDVGPSAGRVRRSTGDSSVTGVPWHTATIEYNWPPGSRSSRWFESMLSRDDLEKGDTVTVRVIPGYEDFERADKPLWWYGVSILILVAGLYLTAILYYGWYQLDRHFGRGPASGGSMFAGPAGWLLILLIGVPGLAIAGLHVYFVPWLTVGEYSRIFDPRGSLLELAAERGGPPKEGPLNEYQRRLLAVPELGVVLSTDALYSALKRKDAERIDRYFVAIADPNIAFLIDLNSDLTAILIQGSDDVFRRFLETGVEIPEAAWKEMHALAKRRRDKEKLAILTELGTKGKGAGQ